MLISFFWRWARENVISKTIRRCKYLIIKRDFRVFLSYNLAVKCFTAKIFIKEKTFPFRAGESLFSSFYTLLSPAAKVFMKKFPQTHFLEERSHQLLSLVIMEHGAKVKGFRRCLYEASDCETIRRSSLKTSPSLARAVSRWMWMLNQQSIRSEGICWGIISSTT